MKSILFNAFLFVSFIANAQFMKDDKFIGGTFYATVQKSSNGSNSEGNYSSCTLSPSGGFFLNDKYAIGGGIGYSVTRQKYEYDPDVNQEYRINAVEVHAFASRYFVIADRFFFRATGSLMIGNTELKRIMTRSLNRRVTPSGSISDHHCYFSLHPIGELKQG
jgi:hypothetical protein